MLWKALCLIVLITTYAVYSGSNFHIRNRSEGTREIHESSAAEHNRWNEQMECKGGHHRHLCSGCIISIILLIEFLFRYHMTQKL